MFASRFTDETTVRGLYQANLQLRRQADLHVNGGNGAY